MPTGSIFAAWQPLCMSRRSWVMVTDFKMRVLRLKPEVHILGSSRSIRHTKVKFFVWNHVFFIRKKQNFHAKLIFERHFFFVGVRDSFTFFLVLKFPFVSLEPQCLPECLPLSHQVFDLETLKQWEAITERTFCQNPPPKLFMVLQYRTKNLNHVALHSLCTSKQMIP